MVTLSEIEANHLAKWKYVSILASEILLCGQNSLLNDSKAQRIGTGMDTNGGSDLIGGNLLYIISFFLQYSQCLIPEGKPFFDIVSISDRKAVALDS